MPEMRGVGSPHPLGLGRQAKALAQLVNRSRLIRQHHEKLALHLVIWPDAKVVAGRLADLGGELEALQAQARPLLQEFREQLDAIGAEIDQPLT